MLRILPLGASGLVGRETLRLALGRGDVDGVVAPTRKPLPPHGKLINPVAGELESLLSDAARWTVEAVICALGTTMAKAVRGGPSIASTTILPLGLRAPHISKALGH